MTTPPTFQPIQSFAPEDLKILRDLQIAIVANSTNKGFRAAPEGVPEEVWNSKGLRATRVAVFVANQHGEVSEAWEANRKSALELECDKAAKMAALGLPRLSNAAEEIADVIIRALDMAEFLGVDPAEAVAVKMAFNTSRPFKHGDKVL